MLGGPPRREETAVPGPIGLPESAGNDDSGTASIGVVGARSEDGADEFVGGVIEDDSGRRGRCLRVHDDTAGCPAAGSANPIQARTVPVRRTRRGQLGPASRQPIDALLHAPSLNYTAASIVTAAATESCFASRGYHHRVYLALSVRSQKSCYLCPAFGQINTRRGMFISGQEEGDYVCHHWMKVRWRL